MIYYSVLCSNYLALFNVLYGHGIAFEWHSKRQGAGRCYVDFFLFSERDPTFAELEAEFCKMESSRGKGAYLQIINEYEV